MRDLLRPVMIMGLLCSILCVYTVQSVYGDERTEEKQRMQQQLNDQVMSKPFSVVDEAKVKAYIEDAQKRKIVPQPYTGTYWRPGYTCYDLRPYSYQEYLSCRYYYSYYGHYYR